MPWEAIAALASPIVGGLAGDIFGGSQPNTQQAVPRQLGPLNTASIQGLMSLLGFGGPNPWNPQQQAPQAQQPHQGFFGGGATNGQSGYNPWGLNSQNGMPQSMQPQTQPQQQPGGGMGMAGSGMLGSILGNPAMMAQLMSKQGPGSGPMGGTMGQLPGGMMGGMMGGAPGGMPGNVAGILGAAGQGQLGMGTGINQSLQQQILSGGGFLPNPGFPMTNGANMGLGMAPTSIPGMQQPASGPGSGGLMWNAGGGMGGPSPLNGGQGTTGSPMDQTFGKLGQPLTQLQQQSLGGMSNYFNSPAPEMQALQQSMPMLQNLLGNNPGAGVISALKPFMQQGLGMANQEGGRFGSANALRQSQVMNDFGLMASQAAQQGVNQQLQGANQLGILSSAAGQNPFNRLGQAFGLGQSQAGQQDVGLQRALQIMQQGAFGFPITQSPSGLQQGAQLGGSVGQLMALMPYLQGQGGGIPGAPSMGNQNWSQIFNSAPQQFP